MNFKKVIAAVMSISAAASALTSAVAFGEAAPISEIVQDSGLDYDYARALQYSIYFYDANMCGTDVEENNLLSWRGNCHSYDAKVPLQPMDEKSNGTNLSASFISKYKDILDPDGDGCVNVQGGFHDAGDHVEFGMPENYAAATLGWGYYEFRDAYVKTGQDDHIETIIRYFNDYLMRCTFRDESGKVIAHCYQVGDGDIDHAIWQSPESDTMARPAFFLTPDKPQTDYVVSAAASLAINYLNFKDTDPEYAEKSLDYAKALWDFANDNPKDLSDNGDGPKQYYSSNKWEDDYCWAASWLYECTGDASYFDEAVAYYDYYAPSGWAYCWNDVWSGTGIRWATINQQHPELNLVQKVRDAQGKNEYVFDDFWDEVVKCFKVYKGLETPGGYAFLQIWGSARYNTAMQLIALVYDKYTNNGKPSEHSEWAQKQMHYIMGDNPLKRAYIVGYNDNAVKYPHHRAASGLLEAEDPREHRHILWGALAGGPGGDDSHTDITSDWVGNEVTIDYNAAFVGACAGLYTYFGTPDMAPTPDFPPVDEKRGGDGADGEGGGKGYWVEACGIDDIHSDGAGVTKVSLKVMTGSNKPSNQVSVRYYYNFSECSNIPNIKASELYDQAATELEDVDGVISGPFKYDKTPDTYYVEIKWDDCFIANSGKKYQFLTGMYYGDKWDPSNDWSYDGLEMYTEDDAFFGNGNEKKTDKICVYADGVLVGGIEPDGSTPVEEEEVTTTKPPKTTTTTSKTTAPVATTTTTSEGQQSTTGKGLAGDANCDKTVNMADAVLIMQYIANPSKYGLDGSDSTHMTEQGKENADCAGGNDGVTNLDALAIQKYLLKLIDALPEIA
ncbi:MAG: glycoside hydrolase family 9 protein [Ruminococcus sp.]|nr:glycoside hydrolase family 9 protein [Ruminococcus sp.]